MFFLSQRILQQQNKQDHDEEIDSLPLHFVATKGYKTKIKKSKVSCQFDCTTK